MDKKHYRRNKRKVKKRHRAVLKQRIILAFSGILICVGIVIFCAFSMRKTYKNVTIEAGTAEIETNLFLRRKKDKAEFVSNIDAVNFSKPGEYTVEFKVNGKKKVYTSKLLVADTLPPAAKAENPHTVPGEKLKPEDFVSEIEDATDVTVSFLKEPDFDTMGEHNVVIILEDQSGNKTEIETVLSVGYVKRYIAIEAGGDWQYEDFVVADDVEISLITDITNINVEVAGIYEVELIVADKEYVCILEVV